jgi:CBS domain-containing protein
MRISDVLRRKGAAVHTVSPDTTVRDVLTTLESRRVGALVVSSDGQHLLGIVSERDIVRALPLGGSELLGRPVASIMTTAVRTASPEDQVEDLARTMTEHRIRHVPVVVDGVLTGLVSIGDVVAQRLDELQTERDQLEAYVRTSG